MSANQPGSNTDAPKLNNGEEGKLQPKFNFKFPQINIQNIGHAGPVRSTSPDFYIEDSAIQTSSVKAPEVYVVDMEAWNAFRVKKKKKNKKKKRPEYIVNPMAWNPVQKNNNENRKGMFHKAFQIMNKMSANKPYAAKKPTFIVNQPKTIGSMKPLTTIVPPTATPTIEPPKATTTIEPLKATTTTEPPKATTTEPPKATVTTEPPKATSIEPPKPTTTTTEQPKTTTTTEPPKPTTPTEPSKATKRTSASVLQSHPSRSNLITLAAPKRLFKTMRPESPVYYPRLPAGIPKSFLGTEGINAMRQLRFNFQTQATCENIDPVSTINNQFNMLPVNPVEAKITVQPQGIPESSIYNPMKVMGNFPNTGSDTVNFQTQATCENIDPVSTINNQFNMQPVNPIEAKVTMQPQGIPESSIYNPMKVMGNFPNTGNDIESPVVQSRLPAGIPKSFLGTEGINAMRQLRFNFQTQATCENINPVSTINNQFNMQPVNPVEANITVQQGIPESGMYNPMQVMGNFPNTGNDIDNKCYELEGIESPNVSEDSGNRVSAFERLGPVTNTKKPKLTINLLFSKNEPVREVVDETKKEPVANSPEVYIPVHKRRDILLSVDELVIKYLPMWPWKNMCYSKIVARPRLIKELMLQELKTMKGIYQNPHEWIHVQIKGFPAHYEKNYVLDALLENLRNEHFVPCFIEHDSRECNFLVLTPASQNALVSLHNMGLVFTKNSCVFDINIRYHGQSLRDSLSFHPRLILARRLTSMYHNNKKSLDLSSFCLQPDVSHFLYFPLNRVANQCELMELPTSISWENLQEINLSHNRLQSIEGFQLHKKTPNLRVLDLSYNYIDNITALIQCHGMPLHSFKLEGNPLCTDFTDPEHYIKVARMLFPCLKCLDDVPLRRPGDIPPTVRNYCPEDAKELVDSFLGLYFPLLDSEPTERIALEEMYDDNAMWSLTFPSRMRLDSTYRRHKELFSRFRNIDDGFTDHLIGHKTIARHLVTWPPLQHDYYSFSVDVLYHTDSKTILKISGLMKVLVESLIEDEPLLVFLRTVVLGTEDGLRYRIQNEMVSWNLPSLEMVRAAFKQAPVQPKTISLKLDQPPDDELKKKLIELFMKVSNLDSHQSEGCLELRNWNFKDALEYFMEMVKLDELKVVSEEQK